MTGTEIFFYIILPVSFVAAGWVAVRLNEHRDHNNRLHPGE